MKMKAVFLSMAVAAALLTTSAKAASTGTCTEIPTGAAEVTITVQGVYCLQANKVSSVIDTTLITIDVNNVTIDLNGFKLAGSGAGVSTTAVGILAVDRKNITIRNGIIRGFLRGIFLQGGTSSGHLVEDLLLDGNRFAGAQVEGSGHVIRNNRVVNTGSGSTGVTSRGILVNLASNSVVADNVVSSTSESDKAAGITALSSMRIEVRDNTILDTKTATTTRGIDVRSSTDVTVIGNRILNAAGTGTTGIIDSDNASTGVICIDNTIAGFPPPPNSGCDSETGTLP